MNAVIEPEDASSDSLQRFDPREFLGASGTGDARMALYRNFWGEEIVITNGAQIRESHRGFKKARRAILEARDV